MRPRAARRGQARLGAEPGSSDRRAPRSTWWPTSARGPRTARRRRNEADFHLRGVAPGAISRPSRADVRRRRGRDTAGRRGDHDRPRHRGREHLQAGTRYSIRSARATSTRSKEQLDLRWLYGIGPAGTVAPRSSSSPTRRASPGRVAGTVRRRVRHRQGGRRGRTTRIASTRSCATGLDVLYDEREAEPGREFADAELLGAAVAAHRGPKGVEAGEIEAQVRRGWTSARCPWRGRDEALELWQSLP